MSEIHAKIEEFVEHRNVNIDLFTALKNTEGGDECVTTLHEQAYRLWDVKSEWRSVTLKFQKRIDRLYPAIPLCHCNDKMFVNVSISFIEVNSVVSVSVDMSITSELEIDGAWADFKFYCLKCDDLSTPEQLIVLEKKMLLLWSTAYGMFN